MPSSISQLAAIPEPLEVLRGEIDRIDDAILDLVERRLAASAAIVALKRSEVGDRLKLRPRREAAVIDRLIDRAEGAPPDLVTLLWRTLMSYGLQAQARTEMVLCAAHDPVELLERTRSHFGPGAAIRWAALPCEAIEAARTSEAIAVIEEPLDYALEDERLRVFDTVRRSDGTPCAVAIGRVAPEDVLSPTPARSGEGR